MFNNFLDISNIQPAEQTYMIQEEPSRPASCTIFKGTCDVPFNICVAFNFSWLLDSRDCNWYLGGDSYIKYVIERRRDHKTIRRLIVFLIFCPNLLPALHCSMWPQNLTLLFCCRKCSIISHREWQTSTQFFHTQIKLIFLVICVHIYAFGLLHERITTSVT